MRSLHGKAKQQLVTLLGGTTASLMPTSEKFSLALERNSTGQQLSFVDVGFNQCNPTGCLSEEVSFMLLGNVHFV